MFVGIVGFVTRNDVSCPVLLRTTIAISSINALCLEVCAMADEQNYFSAFVRSANLNEYHETQDIHGDKEVLVDERISYNPIYHWRINRLWRGCNM